MKMSTIILYKVERVFSHKQNKKVWLVKADMLNTCYYAKTKKLAVEKATELNASFNQKCKALKVLTNES